MKNLNLNIWIARLIFCVCVILLYHTIGNFGVILGFASHFWKILSPFVVGGIIAFLFFPICQHIEIFLCKTNIAFIKKRVRVFAVLIVVLLIILILLLLVFVLLKVVPLIYDGLLSVVVNFSNNFNVICDNYRDKFKDVDLVTQLIDGVNGYVSSDNLIQWVSMLSYKSYVGKIASILTYVFNFFIGIIISIYILLERAVLKKTFFRILNLIFSRQNVLQINRACARIAQILYAFIFGQIFDVFLVSYVMGVIFSLFKISNSLSLAAVYFLFALIPYFGSTIGVVLVTFLSMVLSGNNQFIFVLVVALILQQVDANLINPKIVGKAVGLGPFSVILGVVLFGGMFGFYGFFLGTPLMAICLELADDLFKAVERKKNFKIKKMIGNRKNST